MTSNLQETYKHGKFRKARKKESKCSDCWNVIKIGHEYFDTGERGTQPFATIKLCALCVTEDEIDGRASGEWRKRREANGYKGISL